MLPEHRGEPPFGGDGPPEMVVDAGPHRGPRHLDRLGLAVLLGLRPHQRPFQPPDRAQVVAHFGSPGREMPRDRRKQDPGRRGRVPAGLGEESVGVRPRLAGLGRRPAVGGCPQQREQRGMATFDFAQQGLHGAPRGFGAGVLRVSEPFHKCTRLIFGSPVRSPFRGRGPAESAGTKRSWTHGPDRRRDAAPVNSRAKCSPHCGLPKDHCLPSRCRPRWPATWPTTRCTPS